MQRHSHTLRRRNDRDEIRDLQSINAWSTETILLAVVVQSLSCVQIFVTPWRTAYQVSLSFTVSWSLLKLMSVELVMPSNHLTLCYPFLLLPSIFPSIRVFSSELALPLRWPKDWTTFPIILIAHMNQALYTPDLKVYSHNLYKNMLVYPHCTDKKTNPESRLGSLRKQWGQD